MLMMVTLLAVIRQKILMVPVLEMAHPPDQVREVEVEEGVGQGPLALAEVVVGPCSQDVMLWLHCEVEMPYFLVKTLEGVVVLHWAY